MVMTLILMPGFQEVNGECRDSYYRHRPDKEKGTSLQQKRDVLFLQLLSLIIHIVACIYITHMRMHLLLFHLTLFGNCSFNILWQVSNVKNYIVREST